MLDLVQCRRALVECQVKGELDSMESLANAVGVSRSTASRFFAGKPTSLTVTLRILDTLHLRFDEVATHVSEQPRHPENGKDDGEGMAGASVLARTGPGCEPGGAAAGLGWRTA
jgi:transcriptional regulator with XRE-family HTH domain